MLRKPTCIAFCTFCYPSFKSFGPFPIPVSDEPSCIYVKILARYLDGKLTVCDCLASNNFEVIFEIVMFNLFYRLYLDNHALSLSSACGDGFEPTRCIFVSAGLGMVRTTQRTGKRTNKKDSYFQSQSYQIDGQCQCGS